MKERDGWCDGVNETLYLSPHLCRGLYLSNPSPLLHVPSLHRESETDGERERKRKSNRETGREREIESKREKEIERERQKERWTGLE